MNKKVLLLIIVVIIFLICISIIFFIIQKNNNSIHLEKVANQYESNKLSTNDENTDNSKNVTENAIKEDNTSIAEPIVPEVSESPTQVEIPKVNTEEKISAFSTKIYSKDSARQNNIQITCSTLDDTIVSNGETFSFCHTVGQSTTAKGYEKADVFDANGNKKKGLGGGNCQISTTLYNAILPINNLKIIERHKHSNSVPYIQKGKDAAVAYGSYDLKFINNTGNDIKIKSSSTPDLVSIALYKLI